MLTKEILQSNAATAALTEEQAQAIVLLSQQDEASVIGQKTGEIYGGLDADILAASGIAKNGTEKTYDYAKRVIGEIKGQVGNANELQTKIAELTKENNRLNKVIADGGADAETKRALTQARADLANVTKDYTELRTAFDNAKAEHEKKLFDIQLDGEFTKAASGLKFKADLPQSVTNVLLQQAIEKVKARNPEYIDDGNGGKVLAFMENGAVLRNKENLLQPFTAAELLAKELETMQVLDTGRKQTGTGAPQNTPPSTGGAAELSGARTQEEARTIIEKQLLSQGKLRGSKEFFDEVDKIWKDNYQVIKTLPLR